jgi:hypothetical protein
MSVTKLKGPPELGIVARIHINLVVGPDDEQPFLSIKNLDKLSSLTVVNVLAAAIQHMLQIHEAGIDGAGSDSPGTGGYETGL